MSQELRNLANSLVSFPGRRFLTETANAKPANNRGTLIAMEDNPHSSDLKLSSTYIAITERLRAQSKEETASANCNGDKKGQTHLCQSVLGHEAYL